MARIVIGSYLVRYPLGGMLSWALQYVVGLHRLGHDVVVVERADYPDACFDPIAGVMTDDATRGVATVAALLNRFGLPDSLCFVDVRGTHHGLSADQVRSAFASADLFVDMGTHGGWSELAALSGRRAHVDGEPGFTQLKREAAVRRGDALPVYDSHWTSGLNVGTARSAAPTGGVAWHPLVHPVVLELLPPSDPPSSGSVTTVMNWQSYGAVEHDGVVYGHKDLSFELFADLPSKVGAPVELAVAGSRAPTQRLVDLGWRVRSGHEVTATVDQFWSYVRASRAEFSLCKQGYVALRTGWFSDRGGAYLASGRPVVQQDTGFGDALPCGEGLFAVGTVDEAAAALDVVLTDPARHSRAAREIAVEHLGSAKVLSRWLDTVLT